MELTKHESFIPGENEAIQKLVRMLENKMKVENPAPSKMKRDAHPKQIGLLKAEFIIEPNLPADLQIGLFKEVKSYLTWIRFSNASSPRSPDKVKDIRGMAIKLIGVEGDKLLISPTKLKTHDFLLISANYFVTRNVVEFAELVAALVSNKLKLGWYFISHPKILYNVVTSNKNFGSLLETRFWSVSPYLFGDRVVKYSVKPCSSAETPIPNSPSDNYLTEVMSAQLEKKEYLFDFMIQFQRDPQKMPVEDLGNPWNEADSPFIKVATLKIPIQKFTDPKQFEFGDNLSFTPWHCLPEHRPLGSVNRGRRAVYDELSKFRHAQNGLVSIEPENLEIS